MIKHWYTCYHNPFFPTFSKIEECNVTGSENAVWITPEIIRKDKKKH